MADRPSSPVPRRPLLVLSTEARRTLKVIFLLLKLLSLSLPCMPLAASPKAALPLLALAILDLLVDDYGIYLSVSLMILHLLVFFAVRQAGILCVSKVEPMFL